MSSSSDPTLWVLCGTFIDGAWDDSGDRFDDIDPFTERVLATYPASAAHQVERAVESAANAAAAGPPPPHERASILRRAAALLGDRKEEFVERMILEVGLTRKDASADFDRSIVTLGLCAEEATRIVGETVAFGATPGAENRIGFTVRMPVGVVCAITPFNSPLNVVLHKVAPAFAAGNAVILKPSPLSPFTPAALVGVLSEAGIPPGFLSLVNGAGPEVGEQLVADDRIDFFTFTGSTPVGRAIQRGAGLRGTQLELGSIASTILCADAALDSAVAKIANAGFRKAGQVCTSLQRLYVERSVLEPVTAALVAAAHSMPAGDPADPATAIGPVVSRESAQRIRGLIADAVERGAEVVAGGTRVGALIDPTILTSVPDDAAIMRREVFGPVIMIIPFDDLDDAIRSANATPYGLSCGFYSGDQNRVHRAIRGLRFGAVHINEASSARADEMPFGGVKDSGHGHEGPKYAVREYTQERLITLNP